MIFEKRKEGEGEENGSAWKDFSSDRESIGHVRSFSVEIKYGAISR